MRNAPGREQLLVAAYRALLSLYPAEVSPAERDEIAECFVDMLHAARHEGGRWAQWWVAARAFAALPYGLLQARCEHSITHPRQRATTRKEGTMRGIGQDLRLAVKGLLRSPGFALLAIASLALGAGANATILGMVSSVLWTELPVPSPERIVRIFQTDARGPRRLSYGNYRETLERTGSTLDGLFVHRLETFGLRSDTPRRRALDGGVRLEGPERARAPGSSIGSSVVNGELVSGGYFDTLRPALALGRFFTRDEVDHAGARPVIVLAHDLWSSRFAADPNIVGQRVRLNDHPFEVIGVADRSFHGTKFGLAMDLWVPIWSWAEADSWPAGWDTSYGNSSWLAVARLADGVDRERAAQQLEGVAEQLREIAPEANRDLRLAVFSEIDGAIDPHIAGIPRLIGILAVAASALVLLVSCANVASILFARALGRRREIGIRFALGVGRWRLVRQLLTESVLLAFAGGAVGLAVSPLTARTLLSFLPSLPYRFAIDPTPDARVVALICLIALASALVFGLAPALQASATKPLAAMRGVQGQRSSRPHRGLSVVVVAMVSLSFASIIITGLFLRSLREVREVAPGFETTGRVLADYDIALAGDPSMSAVTFAQRLIDALEALPGVERAAVSSLAPLGDRSESASVFANERDYATEEQGVEAWRASVSDGYFEAMGSTLVAGRAFDSRDTADSAPVVILNATLAQQLWPGGEPLGRYVRSERLAGGFTAEVVGVVADGKYNFLSEAQKSAVFRPWAQSPRQRAVIVAEGDAGVDRLLPAIPRLIEELDARVPTIAVRSLDAHVRSSLWIFRLGGGLAAGLGFLALGLSAAGLYGVMAYSVSQRKFELGVRTALGASRRRLLRLIVGRGLRLAMVGLAIGLLLALALGSAMSSVLFGVSARDPVTLAFGLFTLVVVAFLASLFPALGASKLDPVQSLKGGD